MRASRDRPARRVRFLITVPFLETTMLAFRMTIHRLPEAVCRGREIEVSGRRVVPLEATAEIGRAAFASSFEEVFARLAALPRMFIEPDGSFVWVSDHAPLPWQVDGNLIDAQGKLRYVELKGTCPVEAWEQLLATLGWPDVRLAFQWVEQGVFFDEPQLRRFAKIEPA